jgi:hypothetical protein|tara:strand:- start:527 stop:685 length:159 start_codon:yes stop_codon:yes gene_type:complete
MNTIEFTKDSFKRFKQAYKVALENNKESFLFLEKEFVTTYAKYLIEHLKDKL